LEIETILNLSSFFSVEDLSPNLPQLTIRKLARIINPIALRILD